MTRYHSVRDPRLVLDEDDVWECDECQGTGEIVHRLHEYRQTVVGWCEACDGHGLVHGFTSDGEAMPVEVVA